MVSVHGLSSAVLVLLIGIVSILGSASDAAPQQVRLAGHIPLKAVAQAHLLGRVGSGERLTLALALPLRDPAGLAATLKRLYDPQDALYGHYLTSDEFTRRFGPTQQSYQSVIAFARSRGLTVIATHPNRLLLDVSGPVSTVESAFNLHLLRYQAPNGRTFHAPDVNPLIPAALAGKLSGIVGLSNANLAHPHLHKHANSALKPSDVGTGPFGGLSPIDFKTVYNLNSTTLDGSGQTLALYELDGYLPSDITAYENYFSLPAVPLQNVLVGQADGSAGDGADEVTLDIELMTAVAPGADNIIVYEGKNGTSDQVDTYNRIATDNLAKSVSTSWGLDEPDSDPADLTTENTIFQQMAAQGQSLYAASGDSGAYDDGVSLSVDDPASQPYVTGVGGTTLHVRRAGGDYASESAWGIPETLSGGGGGGGVSSVWPIPDYQSGVSGLASTTKRNVPDVSLDANPDTGYAIYVGGWTVFGGTSCAAPLWAAYTALVNQQRAANLLANLGFANPSIYQIAESANYTTAFHDIADGSTNFYYIAETGYDNATGWGSFNGVNLLNLLAPSVGTVNNPLVSLVFNPSPAFGGHAVTGTVTLTRPVTAPLLLTLASDDTTTLPIPATVIVPTSASSVTFTATPTVVTASKVVTVTVTSSNGSISTPLTVEAVPFVITPTTLTFASDSVFGSKSTVGTVTLNGPAPTGGLTVALTSSNPVAIVPASFTIPAGAVTGTFTVLTQAVTQDTAVALTATTGGITLSASLTVTAPALGPIDLTPTSVVGGHSSTGTLSLNGPAPAGGIAVTLSTDNTAATISPLSIVIPVGSTTANFTVTTTVVTTLTRVKVQAVGNSQTQSETLTVQPGGLSGLSVFPVGVICGQSATGTATLDSPAGAGGAVVALTSSDASVTVPATVTIPQGATSAPFTVLTTSVSAPETVTLQGTLNGTVQSASLTVTPIQVKTLTISPVSALVGSTVTGTITLTSPALVGGLTVTLTSSSAAATVPAAITIPLGQSTATFSVTPVQGGSATISAATGGKTATAGLTVQNFVGTTFPAGLNFLAVPYDYSGLSLDSVFGYTGVKLAVWQPTTGAYAITPTAPADALRPGVGFWVRLPHALTLALAGTPPSQTTNFSIPLSPGWNQIGDPFPVTIKRSSLSIASSGTLSTFLAAASATTPLVSDLVYRYSPGVGTAAGSYVWVTDSDALQPGLGYWVYAYQAVTLIVPHPGS